MSVYKRFAWGANHGSEQPCRMIIYDTETVQSPHPSKPGVTNHTLRVGVLSLWRRAGDVWKRKQQHVFTSPAAFWEAVYRYCKAREPLWIFSHNQAFDFTIIDGWGELASGNLRVWQRGSVYTDHRTQQKRTGRDYQGVFACDGLPFIITAKCDRGSVRVIDTLNYIPMSLAKLGKWVGIPKGKLPDDTATNDDWIVYCRNDVAILEAAVTRLLRLWADKHLGTWQMTTASLAYASFRHVSPRNGIVAHGDEPSPPDEPMPMDAYGTGTRLDASEVAKTERRAYYGGRVMVNFVGEVFPAEQEWVPNGNGNRQNCRAVANGPVSCYDINGLYPAVMSVHKYPVELLETIRNPSARTVNDIVLAFPCVADVQIDTVNGSYPYRTDRRVIWPSGRYITTLAGCELKQAVQLGHAVQVSNLCVYHSGSPFAEYVAFWQHYKETAIRDGDEVMQGFAKLMLNSLFGKLGQRKPLWKAVFDVTPRVPWGGFVHSRDGGKTWDKFRSVARVVQQQIERRDCAHTMTAIAACVTAYGRAWMDDLRGLCDERTVLYQDTDSLYVLPRGAEALEWSPYVHPTELGKLKHTGDVQRMTIYAPKVYTKDGCLTAAGLAAGATQVRPETWEQTLFERTGSIIARGPQGEVQSWKSLYATASRVTPFAVAKDGWVKPIVLN